jgi:hypothetical protein
MAVLCWPPRHRLFAPGDDGIWPRLAQCNAAVTPSTSLETVMRRRISLALSLVLAAAACGGSSDAATADSDLTF